MDLWLRSPSLRWLISLLLVYPSLYILLSTCQGIRIVGHRSEIFDTCAYLSITAIVPLLFSNAFKQYKHCAWSIFAKW